jgi:hypothetical protein
MENTEKKVKNKGNAFWKQRSKHGRDKIFANPESLWAEAESYFQWCDTHTIGRNKLMRPYTLHGLCFYLKIGFTTWQLYKKRPEFKEMTEQIELVIYNNKFTGASIGIFNGNIIARDLGLVDKQDHTIGQQKQQDLSMLTDDELMIYWDLQKKIENGQQYTGGNVQTANLQLHNRIERSETPEAGRCIDGTN